MGRGKDIRRILAGGGLLPIGLDNYRIRDGGGCDDCTDRDAVGGMDTQRSLGIPFTSSGGHIEGRSKVEDVHSDVTVLQFNSTFAFVCSRR